MRQKGKWIIGFGWVALLALAGCRPAATPPAPFTPTAFAPIVVTIVRAVPGSLPTPAEVPPTVVETPTSVPSPAPSVNSPVGGSGIHLTASLSPTCPGPERPGEVCSKPYQGEFIITGSDGAEVARVATDENGTATVSVPPGTYTVVPKLDQQAPYPNGSSVEVTVLPHQIVEVKFDLDTGIR